MNEQLYVMGFSMTTLYVFIGIIGGLLITAILPKNIKTNKKKLSIFLCFIPFIVAFIVSIFTWLYIANSPILAFEDYKTEVTLNVENAPIQSISDDIDEFFDLAKRYEYSEGEYKVFFEKSIDGDSILVEFKSLNNKDIVEITNIKMLERYRKVFWNYV